MSAGPRVLHLVPAMEAGGAQGAAVRLARAMRARGLDAEVVFLWVRSPAYAREPGVTVLGGPRPGPLAAVLLLARLWRHLRRRRPHALIAYLHWGNVLGCLCALLAGVPRRVASQRNPPATYPAAARRLDRWWGRLGVYTAVIAVSGSIAACFAAWPAAYRRRLRVIPNGVRDDLRPPSRSAARAALGLDDRTPVLLCAGRLVAQKNPAFLPPLLAALPGAVLLLAGDGEERAALEAEAARLGVAPRLRRLGEVDPEAMAPLYAAADLLLFPSRYEAFGFTLVEAMSLGLPVLASDIPSSREILQPDAGGRGRGGWCLPLDLAAWRGAAEALLADAEARAALGAAGRSRAADFSLARMTEGYLACCR